MFACFGLRSRQKRLSPISSELDLGLEYYGSPFARTASLGRDQIALKGFKRTSNSGQFDIPLGAPLFKRGSFRKKKKRGSETDWLDAKQPVKILRPTVPNGQIPSHGHPGEKIKKLEAELSSRSLEATKAKEDAEKTNRRLEALTVLVHYLTTECDAFSTRHLKAEIKGLAAQLTNVRLCLDESTASERRLQDDVERQRLDHAEQAREIERSQQQKVASLVENYEAKLVSVVQKQRLEIEEIIERENIKLEQLKTSYKSDIEKLSAECEARLEEQNKQHLIALNHSKEDGLKQVRETEQSFVNREEELLEANRKLTKQQTILKQEAKDLEHTLLSDKDHRLQAVKKLCTALQNEVDSLKSVLEMRNSEIHKLRDQIVDKERMGEELEAAKDKVRSLRAKSEDLQAQMDTKNQLERQLLADHDSLTESLQKEVANSKRLLLENEELQWKLRQREATSCSLPTSTVDLVSRCSTAAARQQERSHKMGEVFSPKLTPRNQRIGSKRYEKWSQSFTHIPEDSRQSYSRDNWEDDLNLESPPPSPRVKGVIEKSNSVSFILDLNEPLSEEPFLKVTSPHQGAKSRTPVLRKKSLKKTSSKEKTNGQPSSCGSSPLCDLPNGKQQSSSSIDCKESDKSPKESKRNVKVNLSRSNTFTKQKNSVSTPESSDGGDGERTSPTGLSWTVPVHSNPKTFSKHIPNNYRVPEALRRLQLPDEDEYDENEFVEVVTLSEELSSASLKTIFNQTPSTSISLSDSDVSQCGSGVDFSFEEDCSDLDENKRVSCIPQEGAGESMVIPDAFCMTDKKDEFGSQISSDSDVNHHINEDQTSSMSWSEDAECDLTSSSDVQEFL